MSFFSFFSSRTSSSVPSSLYIFFDGAVSAESRPVVSYTVLYCGCARLLSHDRSCCEIMGKHGLPTLPLVSSVISHVLLGVSEPALRLKYYIHQRGWL